jgi:hypothetical protein
MGITRDYSTAGADSEPPSAPIDPSDEAPAERPQTQPEAEVEPATESPQSADPAVPGRDTAAPDEPDETPATPRVNLRRLENLAEQILLELRQRNGAGVEDFSVSKLMAGITMVISLALLAYAYLYRDNPTTLQSLLLLGLLLQAITISLLIMGRQK